MWHIRTGEKCPGWCRIIILKICQQYHHYLSFNVLIRSNLGQHKVVRMCLAQGSVLRGDSDDNKMYISHISHLTSLINLRCIKVFICHLLNINSTKHAPGTRPVRYYRCRNCNIAAEGWGLLNSTFKGYCCLYGFMRKLIEIPLCLNDNKAVIN